MLAAGCLIMAPRGFAARHDRAAAPAQAALQAFASGCSVELDATAEGKTDPHGDLTLTGVEAGDHYLHVECAGQSEQEFLISPKPGERVVLKPKPAAPTPDPVDAAQAREELRDLVQKAADARTAGRSDEAITDLRRAVQLDPANSDLHRELGITFLLLKDWSRARIEYLEAIKHDPGEAESHNGLGYALEKLGDIDAAAKEYAAATHLDPDDGEYRQHYFNALALLEAEKDKTKKK
ncbi:MAG TPA: tetratricopeptide repeat protein [Terriglobia bacterium]|nr:tetratricopeptide repeat protein [Terriglobia bacterium]